MPDANVLYAVTALVVAGLVVWVLVVLKTAKEPWARPHLEGHASRGAADAPASPEGPAPASASAPGDGGAEPDAAQVESASSPASDAPSDEPAAKS